MPQEMLYKYTVNKGLQVTFINLNILSGILGHTTPTKTYDTYIHLLGKEKKTAIQLLDD